MWHVLREFAREEVYLPLRESDEVCSCVQNVRGKNNEKFYVSHETDFFQPGVSGFRSDNEYSLGINSPASSKIT